MSDILLFLAYAAACAGQGLDCYTTSLGLSHGLVEGNPVSRFLIAHLGETGTNALKMGFLPLASVVGGFYAHSSIPGFVVAGIGLAAGIANIVTLRKAKVSL